MPIHGFPRLETRTIVDRAGDAALSDSLALGDLLPRLGSLRIVSDQFESYRFIIQGVASQESLRLVSLTSDLPMPGPAAVARLAAVNAPGRSAFVGSLRAVVLGHGGRNKAVKAAAVRQFGPRCDEYWRGDAP